MIILLLIQLTQMSKLLKNTVLGSLTKVENMECVENVSSYTMQSMRGKAYDEAQP